MCIHLFLAIYLSGFSVSGTGLGTQDVFMEKANVTEPFLAIRSSV